MRRLRWGVTPLCLLAALAIAAAADDEVVRVVVPATPAPGAPAAYGASRSSDYNSIAGVLPTMYHRNATADPALAGSWCADIFRHNDLLGYHEMTGAGGMAYDVCTVLYAADKQLSDAGHHPPGTLLSAGKVAGRIGPVTQTLQTEIAKVVRGADHTASRAMLQGLQAAMAMYRSSRAVDRAIARGDVDLDALVMAKFGPDDATSVVLETPAHAAPEDAPHALPGTLGMFPAGLAVAMVVPQGHHEGTTRVAPPHPVRAARKYSRPPVPPEELARMRRATRTGSIRMDLIDAGTYDTPPVVLTDAAFGASNEGTGNAHVPTGSDLFKVMYDIYGNVMTVGEAFGTLGPAGNSLYNTMGEMRAAFTATWDHKSAVRQKMYEKREEYRRRAAVAGLHAYAPVPGAVTSGPADDGFDAEFAAAYRAVAEEEEEEEEGEPNKTAPPGGDPVETARGRARALAARIDAGAFRLTDEHHETAKKWWQSYVTEDNVNGGMDRLRAIADYSWEHPHYHTATGLRMRTKLANTAHAITAALAEVGNRRAGHLPGYSPYVYGETSGAATRQHVSSVGARDREGEALQGSARAEAWTQILYYRRRTWERRLYNLPRGFAGPLPSRLDPHDHYDGDGHDHRPYGPFLEHPRAALLARLQTVPLRAAEEPAPASPRDPRATIGPLATAHAYWSHAYQTGYGAAAGPAAAVRDTLRAGFVGRAPPADAAAAAAADPGLDAEAGVDVPAAREHPDRPNGGGVPEGPAYPSAYEDAYWPGHYTGTEISEAWYDPLPPDKLFPVDAIESFFVDLIDCWDTPANRNCWDDCAEYCRPKFNPFIAIPLITWELEDWIAEILMINSAYLPCPTFDEFNRFMYDVGDPEFSFLKSIEARFMTGFLWILQIFKLAFSGTLMDTAWAGFTKTAGAPVGIQEALRLGKNGTDEEEFACLVFNPGGAVFLFFWLVTLLAVLAFFSRVILIVIKDAVWEAVTLGMIGSFIWSLARGKRPVPPDYDKYQNDAEEIATKVGAALVDTFIPRLFLPNKKHTIASVFIAPVWTAGVRPVLHAAGFIGKAPGVSAVGAAAGGRPQGTPMARALAGRVGNDGDDDMDARHRAALTALPYIDVTDPAHAGATFDDLVHANAILTRRHKARLARRMIGRMYADPTAPAPAAAAASAPPLALLPAATPTPATAPATATPVPTAAAPFEDPAVVSARRAEKRALAQAQSQADRTRGDHDPASVVSVPRAVPPRGRAQARAARPSGQGHIAYAMPAPRSPTPPLRHVTRSRSRGRHVAPDNV